MIKKEKLDLIAERILKTPFIEIKDKEWTVYAKNSIIEVLKEELNTEFDKFNENNEALSLIKEILWDMNWFGNFGSRKNYLFTRIDELNEMVKK